MSRFAEFLSEWSRLLNHANSLRLGRRIQQNREEQRRQHQRQLQQHYYQFNVDLHPLQFLQPVEFPRIRPVPTVYFREDWIDNLFIDDLNYDLQDMDFDNQYYQDILDHSLQTAPLTAKKTSEGKSLIRVELPISNTFECAICLDKSQDKVIVKLPCCKQHLHEECTLKSLKSDCRCPLCRQVIN